MRKEEEEREEEGGGGSGGEEGNIHAVSFPDIITLHK